MTDLTDAQESIADPAPGFGISECTPVDFARAIATIAFTCTAFAAVASIVLILYTRLNPSFDFIHLPGGLIARAVVFGVLTLVAVATIVRLRTGDIAPVQRQVPLWTSPGAYAVLSGLLIVVAVLMSVRVGQYPWAAPDEVHHLVVARNLAEYSAYASGHPDTGFTYFDSFDSVGPAVIGPVALAFKIFGAELSVARYVMAAFFVGLCIATFLFARGLFGAWAGVIAVALLVGTYSSIYLGRTLYGEVPAYMYLLFGMLAWRRALGCGDRPDSALGSFTPPAPPQAGGNVVADSWCPSSFPAERANGVLRMGSGSLKNMFWGLLAGALVACAILSKTIIILVAFSFLGTWVYDRATRHTIRWPHVLFPCLGAVMLLVVWGAFQRMHGSGQAHVGGTLAIYQHYLLFGVSSVLQGFDNAVRPHLLAHLGWLGIVLVSIPVVFGRRNDPAALTMFTYAVFMLFWWFFFTPGQLHRYLWNAYVILAIFTAPWVVWSACALIKPSCGRGMRILYIAVFILLCAPGVHWIGLQIREIATRNEMTPEYALVDAVRVLPASVRIATDAGRVPGLVNFFGGRSIASGVDAITLLRTFDVVITRDSPELRAGLPPDCRVIPHGSFVLLSTGQPTE